MTWILLLFFFFFHLIDFKETRKLIRSNVRFESWYSIIMGNTCPSQWRTSSNVSYTHKLSFLLSPFLILKFRPSPFCTLQDCSGWHGNCPCIFRGSVCAILVILVLFFFFYSMYLSISNFFFSLIHVTCIFLEYFSYGSFPSIKPYSKKKKIHEPIF